MPHSTYTSDGTSWYITTTDSANAFTVVVQAGETITIGKSPTFQMTEPTYWHRHHCVACLRGSERACVRSIDGCHGRTLCDACKSNGTILWNSCEDELVTF